MLRAWLEGAFAVSVLSFAAAVSWTVQADENLDAGVDGIQVHPAFRVERVASEPVVRDPVDLQFDENGTVYVLEMGGYPFASDVEAEYPGNVVVIEDGDGDGVYDRRRVFADRFRYASSILPYRGGLLVASPPDLLWVKDTDGDGQADVREVLITGFSVGNTQHNFNGLLYGLDNWIYSGNGGNSGSIYWPDRPDEVFPIRHRDMRFDLPGRRVGFIGRTTTGFNVAIDDFGRVFTTHNLRHVNHLVFPDRYFDRVSWLIPPGNPDISDHKTGGLDRVYAVGVQDARVNHPEQSGYFSCACGITSYGGGSFPDEFNGNLFVADAVLNLIHRDILRPDGPGFLAGRGRSKVEFLASADRHFRPVNMRVGPDGALYIVDFHRPVIEHPEWIPDELEREMDIFAGRDQGRIYRVFPREGLPRVQPRFDRTRIDAVVLFLEHRNKWWRDTAQRLLVWWNDPAAVPHLARLIESSPHPEARVHAMWTLHGMSMDSSGASRLTEPLLRMGLADSHPGVRENALVMAEAGLKRDTDRLAAVLAMADDPDPRVRMQVALSLGEAMNAPGSPSADTIHSALLKILRMDARNEASRLAILTACGNDPMKFMTTMFHDQGISIESPGCLAFLNELCSGVGARGLENELSACLRLAARRRPASNASAARMLDGLGRGLGRGTSVSLSDSGRAEIGEALREIMGEGGGRDEVDAVLLSRVWDLQDRLGAGDRTVVRSDAITRARRRVADPAVPVSERVTQLGLVGFDEMDRRRDFLLTLLDFRQPLELQVAAIGLLTRQEDLPTAKRLVELWPGLSREVRSRAGDYLIYRRAFHDLLMSALEQGRVPLGQLNLDLERRRRLLWSDDAGIRRRAEALFSDAGVVTRAAALDRMKGAATLAGNSDAGKRLYRDRCATCHVFGGEGAEVGPNLTEIHRKGATTLLSDILDPNAAVDVEYVNYTIEDDTGEIFSGIVLGETDRLVTVRSAGGIDATVERSRIQTMTSSGLSLMPEGLEDGMTVQDMADLLAFLQSQVSR